MNVKQPSKQAISQARARLDSLAKPIGSLGRLEDLGAWVAGCQGVCPPEPLDRVRVVLPAGDHGVVASRVTSYPAEVTPTMVRALVAGVAGMSALAAQHRVPVRILDVAVNADLSELPADVTSHKMRRSCGSIDVEDALTADETERALRIGTEIVDEECAAGVQLLLLGDLGIGNTTPAAALIAVSLGLRADQVTGRGAGLDDAGHARKVSVIQTALDRASMITDPMKRLAALGSADMAVAVGILLAASRVGLPVLLDGVITGAEALIARDIKPVAAAWWQAGHVSAEPAHRIALEALGLQPILDLGMRLGEGSGAMTALPVLQSAVAVLRDVAVLTDLIVPA